ncbi:1870_t:CDS:10 [Funneliformis caledonium]|uniref:1870_t:CDS:1 n=1 Tax=Funneliformis caledonium TaxID=1117310 RepID=A0A9N9DGQ8_9GLOM|nr:1870_t:CDS:10 [Funneliformis caledonium]
MTAVLRSVKFLNFTAPTSENTHSYFNKVPSQYWQLKHYLSFCLKNDEVILPWSTVYDAWQTSLNFISKNCNKRFPGCVSSFCTELCNICNTYEGSVVLENCEKFYEEFYQRSIDLQFAERLRLLEFTIFSEHNLTKYLRKSDKKRIGEDNEEPSSFSEKRIRREEYNVDNYVLKDHTAISFSDEESETEEISQPVTEQEENSPFNTWILTTGKNVSQVLEDFRSKIPKPKAYLYPAFFGILDLSGEDTEVKKLFTDDEWSEMKNDFSKTVEFKDIKDNNKPEGANNSGGENTTTTSDTNKNTTTNTSNEAKQRSQEEMLYDLFDKIQEAIRKKPDDLITAIEKCTIEGNPKINSIRRLIQTYAYNLERLQTSITKAIGEIQSIASAFITNSMKKPTDRSLIGQKCDFRVTSDGFEMVIGLRSGGLPEACKSKKLDDKIDLMVAMRDVLLQEAIENNGVECIDFKQLYTIGVHSYGFFYNVYAMDWKSRGLWRLGLLKKTKLPQSNLQLLIIEKLVVTLLRIESTLNHIETIRNDLVMKASRLHRKGRTSIILKQYAVCEQRVRRIRILKDLYKD